MPLILFTGFPCSSKTTYAQNLRELLEAKIAAEPSLANFTVAYHSDETLGITHLSYTDSQSEKSARSKIISVVKRNLSKTCVVILDSLNYIKGLRYQLHCEAKNSSTTYCLIYCMVSLDNMNRWNVNKGTEKMWNETLIQQLVQRYEEPNPATRWDSPLFSLLAGEDKLDIIEQGIYRAIFPHLYCDSTDRDMKKLLQNMRPSGAIMIKPASHVNQVQVLDFETQKVVRQIMEYVKTNVVSGNIRVIVSDSQDVNDPACCFVELVGGHTSMAQLQRIRRQFVQMNKLRNLEKDRIVPLFTEYLNKNLHANI